MVIYYNFAYYYVTYMQHIFIIDPREEASICRGLRTKVKKWLWNMFHDIGENDTSTH